MLIVRGINVFPSQIEKGLPSENARQVQELRHAGATTSPIIRLLGLVPFFRTHSLKNQAVIF